MVGRLAALLPGVERIPLRRSGRPRSRARTTGITHRHVHADVRPVWPNDTARSDEYVLVHFKTVEVEDGVEKLASYVVHEFSDGTIIFIDDGKPVSEGGKLRLKEVEGQKGAVGLDRRQAAPSTTSSPSSRSSSTRPGSSSRGGYSPDPLFWGSVVPPPGPKCDSTSGQSNIPVKINVLKGVSVTPTSRTLSRRRTTSSRKPALASTSAVAASRGTRATTATATALSTTHPGPLTQTTSWTSSRTTAKRSSTERSAQEGVSRSRSPRDSRARLQARGGVPQRKAVRVRRTRGVHGRD